jgi:hypothetical protein
MGGRAWHASNRQRMSGQAALLYPANLAYGYLLVDLHSFICREGRLFSAQITLTRCLGADYWEKFYLAPGYRL